MKEQFRIYTEYTDPCNYVRVSFTKQPDGTFSVAVEKAGESK